MIVIMLMALSVVAGQAQETRELTRQEKKEMQARLDSLLHVEAEEAVNARAFTLEADKVMFKYGETAYVTSTTNFVSVKGDDAVVQVAFNVPVSGPNGLGGVTVDGSVSSYEVEKDKRGNLRDHIPVLDENCHTDGHIVIIYPDIDAAAQLFTGHQLGQIVGQPSGQTADTVHLPGGGSGDHRKNLFRYMDVSHFIGTGNIFFSFTHAVHAPFCDTGLSHFTTKKENYKREF